jgi:hypothetical protein
MSIACSISSTRDGGTVSFADWSGLNEYEKLAASAFQEGIENGFRDFPPSLSIDATEENAGEKDNFTAMQDVLLRFDTGGGFGDDSPAWTFSLKDALTSVTDCYPDDVRVLIAAMRRLADYAEGLISNPDPTVKNHEHKR